MENKTSVIESLKLTLLVDDVNVVKYLNKFEEPERSDKAIEALRVGVIAIQSASPSLDTTIVEDKFREVQTDIDACIKAFENDLKGKLEENFKPGSGNVPRSIENAFGEKGTVSQVFEQYFDLESGKVRTLLERQLGPSRVFSKSLDPNNKEGVICLIEDAVKGHLQTKVKEVVDQFSLDVPESGLTKLKSCISTEIDALKKSNNDFFSELKTALGIEAGKLQEAERGTQKGREFEDILYESIAMIGRGLGDTTENVGGTIGKIGNRKVGDYVITLGNTSAAPGKRIVVEVKKEHGYKLPKAIDELEEAKKNRESEIGIFVFERNYAPIEMGDFYQVVDVVFVTVDEEGLNNNETPIFLEAAYKISRALIVTEVRKEQAQEIDVGMIKVNIDKIAESIKRSSDIITKVKTISKNSEIIQETAESMQNDIQSHLDELTRLIQ
jgi:hypothetical protein